MQTAPCSCGSDDLDIRVVIQEVNNSQMPPDNVQELLHVICRSCYKEWVE